MPTKSELENRIEQIDEILKDTNLARLALIQEAEKRNAVEVGTQRKVA